MTNQERLVRIAAIERRRRSGKITAWEESAEFDLITGESVGGNHYFGDSSGLSAEWGGEKVLVFWHYTVPIGNEKADNGRILPSNTGIVTQGPRRGLVILAPGHTVTDAHPEHLKYWGNPGEHRHSAATWKPKGGV